MISNATGKRVFEEGMEGYTAPSDSTFDIDVNEENGEFLLTDAVRGDLFVFYDFSGSHAGLLTAMQKSAEGIVIGASSWAS